MFKKSPNKFIIWYVCDILLGTYQRNIKLRICLEILWMCLWEVMFIHNTDTIKNLCLVHCFEIRRWNHDITKVFLLSLQDTNTLVHTSCWSFLRRLRRDIRLDILKMRMRLQYWGFDVKTTVYICLECNLSSHFIFNSFEKGKLFS